MLVLAVVEAGVDIAGGVVAFVAAVTGTVAAAVAGVITSGWATGATEWRGSSVWPEPSPGPRPGWPEPHLRLDVGANGTRASGTPRQR